MRILLLISIAVGLFINVSFGQENKLYLDGQLSDVTNYSPEAQLDLLFSMRYLPELNLEVPTDSSGNFHFLASANVFGDLGWQPGDSSDLNGGVRAYRIWGRYTTNKIEVRIGLQKIDFGSAAILRPIQWFNQIDPRDPLQLTNGVNAALFKYYFPNNANFWLWSLYGNEGARGYDLIETNKKIPEFGGRFQVPTQKGEIALSYHYRTARNNNELLGPVYAHIPENRYAIDGKWDWGIGAWIEGSYVHKLKDVGLFTHQALLTVGADYTFGLGNGVNFVIEHMTGSFDEKAFELENTSNTTASTIMYPLSFFDNISTVLYYSWSTEDFSYFLNYEHQFKNLTGYVMAYYNPDTVGFIQYNELLNQFPGPGFRIMLVYNH